MKIITLIIVITTFFSCNWKKEKKIVQVDNVFINVKRLTYQELSEAEKESSLSQSCCNTSNWRRGTNCVPKEKCYYLKVSINNKIFAALTAEDNYTSTKEELLSKDPSIMYHHHKWIILNQYGSEMCPSDKSNEHHMSAMYRNLSVDEIIIGPLHQKPTAIMFDLRGSENYPDAIPQHFIK